MVVLLSSLCAAAHSGKQEDRKNLSHPVHVDNCVLVSELKQCKKEPPAYTHRDYSAILYLNDDFEGGEFIFTELDGKTVTTPPSALPGGAQGVSWAIPSASSQ
ncbi:Prolyl 3-hydroxylase 2 [Ameca splendens]|uniref:Prolyl 3-hydroxylase 2 n=1 Tax=Ameca splendens TaxID=208324 RepID=A0ABV0Z5P3_9TELE